jgi:Chaperone of endosialidase
MSSRLNSDQNEYRGVLDSITTQTSVSAGMDTILPSINKELTPPLRMRASTPISRVVQIDNITVTNSLHGRKTTISPIGGTTLPVVTTFTITVDATGAGNATPSSGSALALGMTSSQFLKIGVHLLSTGLLSLTKGSASATLAGASHPSVPSGSYPVGFFYVQTDGSNNIANIDEVNVTMYAGGGSGGGFANPMSATGEMIYGASGGTATSLAPNITTTRQVLTGTGTGSAGQAPVWSDDLATTSANGRVSTTTQTWAGVKTTTDDFNVGDGAGAGVRNLSINAASAQSPVITWKRNSVTKWQTLVNDVTGDSLSDTDGLVLAYNSTANRYDVRVNSAGTVTFSSAAIPATGNSSFYTQSDASMLDLYSKNSTDANDQSAALRISKRSNSSLNAQKFITCWINGGATGLGTANGGIQGDGGTGVMVFATSDRRIKKDITDLQGGLDKILALRPVTFNLKDRELPEPAPGFIAQEFAEVFPSAVDKTDDGAGENLPEGVEPWTMSDGKLVIYLTKAIQEQQALIVELKARIDALEAE